jgi:hypothetical protein
MIFECRESKFIYHWFKFLKHRQQWHMSHKYLYNVHSLKIGNNLTWNIHIGQS